MIYSVYDHNRRVYDYYEGDGPRGTHAGAPPAPLFTSDIGATVEQAAWKVPPGSRKIGSGDLPKGRIAAMGGIGDISIGGKSLSTIAVYGGLAYVLWRSLKRGTR